MDIASNSLSLKWYDIIYYKIITKTSETRQSLDYCDIEYMLGMYEAIQLGEYIEGIYNTDTKVKIKEQQEKNTQAGRLKQMGIT